MTDSDKVLANWSKVESNAQVYGGEILTRLFLAHPATQKLFPKFTSIPSGEMAGNADVAAHGEVVLNKLGEILKAKEQHAEVVKPLATTHANKHKIPICNFKLLGDIIVEVLGEKGVLDAAGQDALKRLLGVIVEDIDCVYKAISFIG